MKRILYVISAIGLMFSSCTESEMPQEGGGVVNFTAAEPMSRVTDDGLQWIQGDFIGVIQDSASIVKYEISNASTGTMTVAEGCTPIYASVKANYTAYYSADTTLSTNTFMASLTSQADIKPLLWAKTENQSGADIKFNFEHQYVRLEFTLAAGTEVTDLASITAAKLVGANSKGSFDLVTGVWSDVTSTDDITLKVENDKIIAYTLSQENVKDNVKLVITANSKEFSTGITTEMWDSSKKYLYNVTVGEK